MSARKLLCAVMVVLACIILVPAASAVEGRGFETKIGADFVSAYIWRGIEKHSDLAFQPFFQMDVDSPDVSAKIWTNINMAGSNSGELTEAILTADYSRDFADFWVSLGGIYYNYAADVEFTGPGKIDDTIEAFGRVEWLGGIGVVPLLAVYYDIDQAEGAYGEFGFKYVPEKYHDVEYGFSAMLGYASSDWNNYYFEVNDSSFVDFDFDVFMSWPIEENVMAKVMLGYSALVDAGLQDAVGDDNNVYGGIGLALEF